MLDLTDHTFLEAQVPYTSLEYCQNKVAYLFSNHYDAHWHIKHRKNSFDITLHDTITLRRTSEKLNVAAKQIKVIHREVKIVIIMAIREAETISLFEIDVE